MLFRSELCNKELELEKFKIRDHNETDKNSTLFIHEEINKKQNIPEIITKNESMYDKLNRLSAPSMDLKILMSEDCKENIEEDSPLKQMNKTLQSHIKQLLTEKKELSELAKRSLESVVEEKKFLEYRIKELSSEIETSQLQKLNNESEDLEKSRIEIETEQQSLNQKRNAFNRKLGKVKGTQEQLERREQALKELDVQMKIKQKKLFFKKQALEKEWMNMDEQKEKIAKDMKDIEYEWESVNSVKEKLLRTGKKIGELKLGLKQKCEIIERKENEVENLLSEYKIQ